MIGPAGPVRPGQPTGPLPKTGTTKQPPVAPIPRAPGWVFGAGPLPVDDTGAFDIYGATGFIAAASSNAATFTTPSFTPVANTRMFVVARAGRANHLTNFSWTFSDSGSGSWATPATGPVEPNNANSFARNLAWSFQDVGASPTAITVTVDAWATADIGAYAVVVFFAPAGSTVAQVAYDFNNAGGTVTPTLAGAATNPVWCVTFAEDGIGPGVLWDIPEAGYVTLLQTVSGLYSARLTYSATGDASGSTTSSYQGAPSTADAVLLELAPAVATSAQRPPLVVTPAAGRRRPGLVITRRGATGTRARPPLVTSTSRRILGRIIQARAPQSQAGLASAPRPLIIVGRRRPPAGGAQVLRTPAAPAVTATPPATRPIILARATRALGRIITTRTPAVPATPATAARQPLVVVQPGRARAGRQLLRRNGPLTPIPTPGPHITTSSTRRPGVIRLIQGRPGAQVAATAARQPLVVPARPTRRFSPVLLIKGRPGAAAAPAAARQPLVINPQVRPVRRRALFLTRNPAKVTPVATPRPIVVTGRAPVPPRRTPVRITRNPAKVAVFVKARQPLVVTTQRLRQKLGFSRVGRTALPPDRPALEIPVNHRARILPAPRHAAELAPARHQVAILGRHAARIRPQPIIATSSSPTGPFNTTTELLASGLIPANQILAWMPHNVLATSKRDPNGWELGQGPDHTPNPDGSDPFSMWYPNTFAGPPPYANADYNFVADSAKAFSGTGYLEQTLRNPYLSSFACQNWRFNAQDGTTPFPATICTSFRVWFNEEITYDNTDGAGHFGFTNMYQVYRKSPANEPIITFGAGRCIQTDSIFRWHADLQQWAQFDVGQVQAVAIPIQQWVHCDVLTTTDVSGAGGGRIQFWMDGQLIIDFTGSVMTDFWDRYGISLGVYGTLLGQNPITVRYDEVLITTGTTTHQNLILPNRSGGWG